MSTSRLTDMFTKYYLRYQSHGDQDDVSHDTTHEIDCNNPALKHIMSGHQVKAKPGGLSVDVTITKVTKFPFLAPTQQELFKNENISSDEGFVIRSVLSR